MRRILASPSPNSNYTHLIVFSRILRGANASTLSNPNPTPKRRDLILLAALIEYPGFDLILYETGCAENLEVVRTYPLLHSFTHKRKANTNPYKKNWGAPITDIFPRTTYTHTQRLPAAIKETGNDISDVRAVIMGHLHLDHAGGLEHFVNSNVPIYVHEEELKHACWAVATGADLGVYLSHYLHLDALNWKTFSEGTVDLFRGITLHHAPGHTPGLCMMQVNLERDGTFIWTSDMFHVRENFEEERAHGGLARDHCAWVRSLGLVKRLQGLFGATLVFGHDRDVAMGLMGTKYYE